MSEWRDRIDTSVLKKLKSCSHIVIKEDKSLKALDYAKLVDVDYSCLQSAANRRQDVIDLCQNTEVPIDAKVIAILSWGGMHRKSFKSFYGCREHWLKVCEDLDKGDLSRGKAYAAFAKLRKKDKEHGVRLKGMGPAYFTKLICFLMPGGEHSPRGWIMDQWAACSVNLLFGSRMIKMNASYHWKPDGKLKSTFLVSDANDRIAYENFCAALDALSKEYEPDLHKLDERLVSKGGHQPAQWRKYVVENRKVGFDEQS